MVSVASKDDLELICVVLGFRQTPNVTGNKFIDSKNIFEYGYNNFEEKTFIEQGATVSSIDIPNATEETKSLDLVVESNVSCLVNKSFIENNDIEPRIDLNENLIAPISQGQVVGKIVYNIDGVEYFSNLLASKSVIPSNSTALFLALVIILIILIKLLLHKKHV